MEQERVWKIINDLNVTYQPPYVAIHSQNDKNEGNSNKENIINIYYSTNRGE